MTPAEIVKTIRKVPKRTTAGAGVGIFGIFLLLFPNAISPKWQVNIMYIIQTLGATGVMDWMWRNRKEAFAYIKQVLTKKKKENG